MAAIHDQPSNNYFCETKSETKANENAKAAQFALFLHVFCCLIAFFSGTTSALMRTLAVSNICCTLLGKNGKKSVTKAKKRKTKRTK